MQTRLNLIRTVLAAAIGAWIFAPGLASANAIDELPAGHWYEVPNSKLDSINPCPGDNCAWSATLGLEAIMDSWSGGTFDTSRGRLLIWGGGHMGYAGNEIYAFDVDTLQWSAVTTPSQDVGGVELSGLYPDGLPRSRHTYGNLTYAENVDTMFAIGGAALYPSGGNGEPKVHGFNFSNDSWRSDYNTPLSGNSNHFGTVSYDPVTGSLWHLRWQQANLRRYNPLTDQWTTHATVPLDIDGMSAIDPERRLLVLMGGYGGARQFEVFDLDNPDAAPYTPSSSGDTTLEYRSKIGWTFDTHSKKFVGWDNGSHVYTLDPETWHWEKVSPAASNNVTPTSEGMNGTYGRFQYVPSKNAFVLVNRTRDNVFFFKLTDGGGSTSAPTVSLNASPTTVTEGDSTTLTWSASNASSCSASGAWSGSKSTSGSQSSGALASNSVFTLACSNSGGTTSRSVNVTVTPDSGGTGGDWAARSTAPGVVMATRFDAANDVSDWLAGTNTDHVSWETGNKASGNGSLRFDILKTDGANSGNWARWLRDDQQVFTEGDTFYVQFRQYIPAYYATHYFKDAGGWKQAIISRNASSMAGVSQPQPYGSNQLNEIVLQNTNHRGLVQGYNRNSAGSYPPWDVGANTACSTTDFVYQNAVDHGPQSVGSACENDRARYGGLYSYYQQKPAGYVAGTPDPISGGFRYYPDEWLTFQVGVTLGQYGGYSNDTHVRVWAARDGGDYQLLIDRDNIDLGNGPDHNTLWLLPYNTGRSSDPTRQDTYTLYDEVIVSTDFIAAPGGGTGGGGGQLPTLSLTAANTSVLPGGSTTLTWNSTNVASCTASGGWSGNKSTSGSQGVGPINASTTYTLSCTGPEGNVSRSVTVSVAGGNAEFDILYSANGHSNGEALDGATISGDLWIYVAPETGVSQVQYYLDDPNANGTPIQVENIAPFDFGGSANPYDTSQLSNGSHSITARVLYDGSGNDLVVANFQVSNASSPTLPTISLNASPASIDYGATSTLQWNVSGANSCVASGDWSGTKSTSGSQSVGPLFADSTYILACTNNAGTSSQVVNVLVGDPPSPTLSLTANPPSIPFEGQTTIAWSSTHVTQCTASGDWSGAKNPSGSQTVGPLTDDAQYTLNCSGPGGSITRSVTVDVAAAVPPTLNFSANPTSVAYNGGSTLSWSSTNANSCTASGDWSGSRPVNGSVTVGPLTSAANFTLTCSGAGGTTAKAVSVVVEAQAPVVDLSASPTSLESGQATVLSWTSQNATSCTASGGWVGAQSTSGSITSAPLTATTSFSLTCTGPGGSTVDSVDVTVVPAGSPVVNLVANPDVVSTGGSSVLTWSTANVDSCTASGGWSGSRPVSGSESLDALSASAEYSLSCTGSGGTATSTVQVTVLANAPVVTLTASPTNVAFGGSTTISWSATDADECHAFGAWSGTKTASGSETVSGLTADSTFIIACTGEGGSAIKTADVTVAAAAEPDVSLSIAPAEIAYGATGTITWSATDATSCTAYGAWSGDRPLSGNETTASLVGPSTYALLCEGPGGTGIAAVTANVAPPPTPSIDLTADAPSVYYGEGTSIAWSVENADSCEALGAWTGSKPTSGTHQTGALYAPTTYTLICAGPGGSASKSVVVATSPEPSLDVQTFTGLGAGADPVDWFDTGTGFALAEDDNRFKIGYVGTNAALRAVAPGGADIHSHYVGFGSSDWHNYRYTGRMYVPEGGAGIGVTILSGYPQTDAYYRLASTSAAAAFRLGGRGAGANCTGDPSTGVVPDADTWYRFSVEAEDTGSATELRAKVWVEGNAEPGWQATCTDSGTRRVVGTVGAWTSNAGADSSRYWDDLAVTPLNQPVNPPPFVTLTADPVTVSEGGSAVLSWTAEHAASCVANGGWSGSRPLSGSTVIGPLEESTVFGLTCEGAGGSFGTSVAVSVTSAQPPTMTLSAQPDFVDLGGSTTITWSSDNASLCLASGGWTGIRDASGSETVTDLVEDTVFTLKCLNTSGFVTKSVVVEIDPSFGPPLVEFVADITGLAIENEVLLLWETEGAGSCQAGGEWTGNKPLTGQEWVGPIITLHTFTLTCTGPGGVTTQSVTLSFIDDDEDGLADAWEEVFFGDLDEDGTGDSDGDGLLDRDEFLVGTSPLSTDSDHDGETDYEEFIYGSDPRDNASLWQPNRPATPVLAPVVAAPLWGFSVEPSNGYSDPNGDPLAMVEWELSTEGGFEELLLHREVQGSVETTLPSGVLEPRTKYFLRTRHWDESGAPSEWSDGRSFISAPAYPNDSDGDGTDDTYQVDGFADVDGNGVDDASEGMCNLHDAEGNSIVALGTSAGEIQCFRSLASADLPGAEVPAGSLPFGMFSFRVSGLNVNADNPAMAIVTIHFPEALDPDSSWYKFDEASQTSVSFDQFATISGNRVTLTLRDGAFGDADGVVNGIIIDPSGPSPAAAVPPPSTPSAGTSSGSGGDSSGGGGAAGLSLLLGLLAWLSGRCLPRRRRRLG